MWQIIPAPRTPRDLFELFALYERERGLDALFNTIDLAGMDRAAVRTAVLGKLPPKRLETAAPALYNPRVHLRNLMGTQEFRDLARPLILNAFPEKRRAIFVHIPKCAGTDMTDTMRLRYPVLPEALFSAAAGVPPESLFWALRNFVLGLRYADTIGVTGHERLSYYQKHRLVRARDWLFTTVRDPAAVIYSHVCFVLTICQTEPTTSWLGVLGLKEMPPDIGEAGMRELASQVLFHPALIHDNYLCRFLGEGTAASALERIVASDIEITDISRYPAWRRAAFPGARETRANVSTPFFSEAVATPRERAHVAALTQQDRMLFRRIEAALAAGDKLSIRGRELG